MTDWERLAESIDAEVIVAETTTADDFRRHVLRPACEHAAGRIRDRRPMTEALGVVAFDYGDGPWQRKTAARLGDWALESWMAMAARLAAKFEELERVRVASLDAA